MNTALVSPNENAYSETFIQAHKRLLKGKIHYYFGGYLPTQLEGELLLNSRILRILHILKGHFRLNRFTAAEILILNSFKNKNIDLVFAEYGNTASKVLPICRELELPLIVHFHGHDISVVEEIKAAGNYKDVFEYATYCIAVSKKMYGDLQYLGCPEEKLVYNPYGPAEDFFEIEPSFSKPHFIAAGRFVDKKAPYYLILSFLKVVDQFPDARLIIGGDGDLLNSCWNLVRYYKLEKNIELPGVLSPNQFRKYLQESLAFVQHSIVAEDGDSEGTPVAILEASAAGLPVISTRHAGIPDVIIHERTGLLVNEHEVDAMANNMIRLLKDSDLAKILGGNGKKNISEHYTLERHINVLNKLIENAVAR